MLLNLSWPAVSLRSSSKQWHNISPIWEVQNKFVYILIITPPTFIKDTIFPSICVNVRKKNGAVLSIIKSFHIKTIYTTLTSPRKATKHFYMCLRMKLSNENVPGDKAGFVLLGFVVCGLLVWFFNSPEKMKKLMDTCLSNTSRHPTIKWAMCWSFWFELSDSFCINHSNTATVLKLPQNLLAQKWMKRVSNH